MHGASLWMREQCCGTMAGNVPVHCCWTRMLTWFRLSLNGWLTSNSGRGCCELVFRFTVVYDGSIMMPVAKAYNMNYPLYKVLSEYCVFSFGNLVNPMTEWPGESHCSTWLLWSRCRVWLRESSSLNAAVSFRFKHTFFSIHCTFYLKCILH